MADKFIRHGETFNGDGTSSAAATSNGGVGAWNNINILEGTSPAYGSLAAGDVVYIRSKNASGADITRTLSTSAATSLGSSAATVNSWIVWVLDNGDVWPGIDGTLTFLMTAGNYPLNVLQYNRIIAKTKDAIYYNSSSSGSAANRGTVLQGSIIENWRIRTSSTDATFADTPLQVATLDRNSQAINCTIEAPGAQSLVVASNNNKLTIINPVFVVTSTLQPTKPILTASYSASGRAPCEIQVINPSFSGTGITSGKVLAVGNVKIFGGEVPSVLTFAAPNGAIGISMQSPMPTGFAIDGRLGSVMSHNSFGLIDSRADVNYPYLNATYPDSTSTPMSVLLRPSANYAGVGSPTEILLSKFKTTSDSYSTLTVECLVSTSYTGLHKGNCWIEVTWIDASGAFVSASTFDINAGSLDSSTAAWYPPTPAYGAVSLAKRKLSVVLPGGVKQDTMIFVRFCVGLKQASADDIVFVCPDVEAA